MVRSWFVLSLHVSPARSPPDDWEENDPMFRCKVCGWIHEGIAPPNECPSCGAPADRFRAMDPAEVGVATRELSSYGIAGQGFDIDIDDTRRIRLLAFVD